MKIQNYSIDMLAQNFSYQESKNSFTNQSAKLIGSQTSQGSFNARSKNINVIDKSNQTNMSATEQMMIAQMAQKSILMFKRMRDTQDVDTSGIGTFKRTYSQAEQLKFQTTAIIKTSDKEIGVMLEFNLSHSFQSVSRISAFEMMDPLVISLDGNAPSISDEKFSFDIDSDGKADQISKLGANSAFLALDRNGNGEIDDGSELFGTKSGNGFADLALFDDDKNGWIDENDEIFSKLRIWRNDGDEKKLIALGEVGIGAIFLGNVESKFSFRSEKDNEELARLKNGGFFLYENGTAGMISQIDLAKHDKKAQNSATGQIAEASKAFENDPINLNFSRNDQEKMVTTQQREKLDMSKFIVKKKSSSAVVLTKNRESLLSELQERLATLTQKLMAAKTQEQTQNIQIQIRSVNSQIMAVMASAVAG